METCLLNLKRRTVVYIYDLYFSYTNIHTKYLTVKLIVIIIITKHIDKWHSLINECGVLRPPIMVIYYNL